jgi:hypothetical protein
VDGRFQDDPEMDVGTSNVRFESFLTLLNASLNYRDKHGNRYIKKCVDVVTAFLIPDVHQDLYVFVPAEEAKILCDLDERLRPFLRQDGALLVRLLKAIYGLRQGSAEFQLHVTNKLARLGFKPCGAERGVYIKHLPDDEIHIIAAFVDDFFSISPASEVESFDEMMRTSFESVTFQEGPHLKYIGQDLDYSTEGEVTVSQQNYVQEILQKFEAHEQHEMAVSKMPYTSALFKDDPESPLLDAFTKALFCSFVMMLMYLATRTRPDLKLYTAQASTKMRPPDGVSRGPNATRVTLC